MGHQYNIDHTTTAAGGPLGPASVRSWHLEEAIRLALEKGMLSGPGKTVIDGESDMLRCEITITDKRSV